MAIRLRTGFSPDASRVRKVALARAAALAVAGRSASGRIAMPLPSTLSASTVDDVSRTASLASPAECRPVANDSTASAG